MKFILLLFPWFFSSLFIKNMSFYQNLNLPFFAPKPFVFMFVWPILFFLITYSVYLIFKEYGIKENKEYKRILLMNYIWNQLYPNLFFSLHSLFFSFVDTVALLMSSLFLYYESKNLNLKSAKLLIPYLIWDVFAVILSVTIYFMNL